MNMLTIRARNEAIEQLAREHDVKLRRFVMKYSYNKDMVDDLVQSTYIEAIKNLHQFKGQSLLKTWLFGIAYNLVRNHNRSNYKELSHIPLDTNLQLSFDGQRALEEMLYSQFILTQCPDKIANMPVRMRQVFELIVLQGNNYEHAAEELGISVGTVRSRLFRARQWLREKVGAEDLTFT
ncbi:RNA polymerase sigma factor [Vibrio owensii]|uniref:RNA polymerase sigma factor n=1 Tax=Vibrio owensii TaxID=696485 RepID=A0AAU9QAB1_9VIBR|nr:RNA polymerase sigma factor [Vibrio owensii]